MTHQVNRHKYIKTGIKTLSLSIRLDSTIFTDPMMRYSAVKEKEEVEVVLVLILLYRVLESNINDLSPESLKIDENE